MVPRPAGLRHGELERTRMSDFIEIQHDEWVAAAPDVARARYIDL
jgi:hypothetical protein